MTHTQFYIGLRFWCGGKQWLCTDVGSRVVIAISLEPHEFVRMVIDPLDPSKHNEQRFITDDLSLLAGPPHAVAEYVFDEDSTQGCSLVCD